VIRAWRALVAGAVGAAALAACATPQDRNDLGIPGGTDPCADVDTCVRLDVNSTVIQTIDQLELDLVYAGYHATTTTGTIGQPIDVPFSIPVRLNLPGSPLIDIAIVAAGKLGGQVLGAGAESTTVQQGHHALASIFLEPSLPCTEGGLYCGGSHVAGDPRSIYRCTGGAPIYYFRCSSGCIAQTGEDAECIGLGLCHDGGTYCGGHIIDGEPNTLYVCSSFEGTDPTPCPNGCQVRADGNDACQ
jgi:hypothetical protein